MIWRTSEELKDHVGGTVNAGFPLSSLTAAYRDARRNHLERYLSAAFLDELQAAVQGNSLTAAQQQVIERIGPALGMLTLYEYSFVGSVQMGGEGLVTIDGDQAKSAYKYQVADYRQYTKASGLNALDAALEFLEVNAADYLTWSQSRAARYHRQVLIRTAAAFRDVHNQATDRRAYEAMRPILRDLHVFVATSLLGDVLLQDLLDAMTEGNASTEEQELTDRLQSALATYTVHEALRRNLVQLEDGRVVQFESLEPQSVQKSSNPSVGVINIVDSQNFEFAERHLSFVRDYLKRHATAFPAYIEWLELSQPDPDIAYPSAPDRRYGGKVTRL